uniref:Uncharacterized protein n=1 Tax=viral metagenome TaxID=1070528 RepID=A0A6C0J8C3_9ZZZZ
MEKNNFKMYKEIENKELSSKKINIATKNEDVPKWVRKQTEKFLRNLEIEKNNFKMYNSI